MLPKGAGDRSIEVQSELIDLFVQQDEALAAGDQAKLDMLRLRVADARARLAKIADPGDHT